MEANQEAFSGVVGQIIAGELHETQHQQYAIEGQELITSLFATNSFPVYKEDLIFDFGIAPSEIALPASFINFTDIINACFLLVGQATPISDWRTILLENGTNEALTDLLCNKYNKELQAIIHTA
jgi:hypothetical protein